MNLYDYLNEAVQRLTRLSGAWALAALLGGVALLSVAGGVLVMAFIPAASTLLVVRLLLVLLLLVTIVQLWRHRPGVAAAVRRLERRVPVFGGRLATWLDAARRDERSGLFELLTRQTGQIAAEHRLAALYPWRRLLLPGALAGAAAVLLSWLLTGAQPWQLAAQRLWLGDALADARPHVLVQPGDVLVRRGSDVVLRARARGFLPGQMAVSADFGNGWERAAMTELGAGEFGFVLVGVTQPVAYYVSARGISSARYQVRVADLPRVTGVETVHTLPAWTGRPAETHQRGDVRALPGTRVAVTAVTDRPVAEPLLVVDGLAVPMAEAGSELALQAGFDVTGPGSWHVAVRHQGNLARISDSYFIELAEDAPPEVTFAWPGHDRRATAIEEVAMTFEADDDYGVASLSLFYAINGGAWQEQVLPASGEALLRLESLEVGGAGEPRKLAPGDVISLYAEARDHSQRARSSLYFVDVRPFDMRYRESQQMGGQGGAEGSGFDIAERQRDILSATWNLINASGRDAQALADEAQVLAMLQRTLADQVRTLVERSTARGLGRDADVSEFIAALNRSLEHMAPAADHLEAQELDDAVPAEQRALADLAAAEASVRDIDVSLSRNQGQGRGSGGSLAELMELEMDPERNRYEVPQQARLDGAGTPGEEAAVDWQRLDELAARQERLADRSSDERNSLPARWEQARLARELTRMREALEAQRAAATAAGEAAGTRGRQSLERALDDLRQADQALSGEDAGGTGEASGQAAEALRRAADTLREASHGNLRERLERAARQVSNLNADQARVMEALDELQRDSLERARQGEGLARSDFTMQTFGEVKQRMQQDLAQLRGELTDLGRSLADADPDAARILERALGELDEARLDERLAASAEAFELGQPLYVIGSEGVVEQGLGRLQRRVDQAAAAAAGPAGADDTDPLRQVRSLRRRLDEAGQGGAVDDRTVASVARALDELVADGGGGGPDGDGADGRLPETGDYAVRGTDDANTETLLRLTLERLDLMEAMLARRDSPPIRAQAPRQAERDSAAAARYFRALSRASDDQAASDD